MEILAGIVGAMSVILGSILGISHSSVQLMKAIRRLNIYVRIRDKQFKELISDDTWEDIFGLFIIFILFIVPIMVGYGFGYEAYLQTGGNWVIVIFYSLCLFAFGIKWTKQWWPHIKNSESKQISIMKLPNGEFREIVEKICCNVGLYNLPIYLYESDNINAFASKDKKSGYMKLVFSTGCILLPNDEIAALVAHEVAHFKNGDFDKIEKLRRFLGFIIVIGTFYLSLLLLFAVIKIPIIGILLALLLTIIILGYELAMIAFLTIDDRRLWRQIQEIRADRTACTYKGVTCEAMINLLIKLKSQSNFKIPWYKKLYVKYLKVMDHPCLDRRIQLIKNYRKWSFLDYYIHAGQMFKWFITGKGWIGE